MPSDLTRDDLMRWREMCEGLNREDGLEYAEDALLRLIALVEELAEGLADSQLAVENGITLSGDYLAALAKARALLPEGGQDAE